VWKNFFNQVLNVHGIHDVRQMDIHTDKSLVPEPTLVELETDTGKMETYETPGNDQTPAEFINILDTKMYSFYME
jgi:hypothetical protein